MPYPAYPPIVRDAAERMAAAWLEGHGYCDCAIQQQIIARRFLPVLAMFERELTLNTPAARAEVSERVAHYCTRAHEDLRKGLHRPGASAADPHTAWIHRGDGTHN